MASITLLVKIMKLRKCLSLLSDRSVRYPKAIRWLSLGCCQPIETPELAHLKTALPDMKKEETSTTVFNTEIKFCQLE